LYKLAITLFICLGGSENACVKSFILIVLLPLESLSK
jgi:hypothetical protein